MKSLEAKVVLLGDQGVGKTSISVRYMNKSFPNKVMSTIGASFFCSKIFIEDYRVRLQVWDTAGHERFKAMAPMFYRNANAAIVVFDITCAQTFDEVQYWIDELKKNIDDAIVICIVGNKIDCGSQRKVNAESAETYARSVGASYIETSAYTNAGVEEMFFQLALDLIKMSQTKAIKALQQAESLVLEKHNSTVKVTREKEELIDKRPLVCC